MGFPWRNVMSLGLTVLNTVIPGVSTIETIARALPNLRGKQKQDAVVELVKQSLATAEGYMARNLVDDKDVEQATRGVIDAVVALQNVLGKKAQIAGVP